MKLTSAVMVLIAACGPAATQTTQTTHDQPTTPPAGAHATTSVGTGAGATSLERLERIARACLADRTAKPLVWGTIDFSRNGGTWRIRVEEQPVPGTQPSYVDVVIDAAASTCDGRAIDSAPADGDADVEAVTTIAARCHAGPIEPERTLVGYHRLTTGDIDRGRFDVSFHEPGTALTTPVPHYVVDFPAGTCKKLEP